ncbi:MAG: lytic transglycosylase domain-containing protein [Halieaceae bacterium]
MSGFFCGMIAATILLTSYGESPFADLLRTTSASVAESLPEANSKQPVATIQQAAAVSAVPTAVSEVPTAISKEPTAMNEVPTAIGEEPTAVNEVPTALNRLPTAINESPAPAATQQTPDLEQRWSDYASQADELEPAGSFPWQQCFQRAAAGHELPQALLLAVASGESNFDPAARSDKDAVGLMQIQWPGTSQHLGIYREADLYDPCTNVEAGARYLSELLRQYSNNLHLAIAAYNYGPSRISAAQVPEGARWYSHYIYQHLQQVLGLDTTATSELMPLPASSNAGRQVLMTFNQAHRARDFIDYLKRESAGLDLQLQTESLGQHAVVLLYSSAQQRRDALQSLNDAGVGFISSQSTSRFSL